MLPDGEDIEIRSKLKANVASADLPVIIASVYKRLEGLKTLFQGADFEARHLDIAILGQKIAQRKWERFQFVKN